MIHSLSTDLVNNNVSKEQKFKGYRNRIRNIEKFYQTSEFNYDGIHLSALKLIPSRLEYAKTQKLLTIEASLLFTIFFTFAAR
ncbi:MAG TPA: hypothetical protein VHO90_15885 [Bacteroidales bacterium]|nr:hypothetical protein [Bacteroidales bacterium]